MQRRDLLAGVTTLATTGLVAGCATNAPAEDPADTPSPHPEPTETPTPTDTPTPAPAIADTAFSVTGVQSGTQVNEASVAYEDDRVVVTGTIAGSDGCKTAYLKDAGLSGGTLAVTVATRDRPDAGVCTQAIVEIGYEATVTFDGALPAGVTVTHESVGETVEVASAER